MIASFADFLLQLKGKEEAILKAQKIQHAPTIGDMYEGLSKELLNRAIPLNVDLQVVDGFLKDTQENLSPQIDCMVVTGNGDRIPHTDSYVWKVEDALAVFEIKKNLYSAEVSDAYPKLRKVGAMFTDAWQADGRQLPIDRSAKAFEMTTGVALPHASDIDGFDLQLQQIFQTIFIEGYAPLRVLLGYQGFASEYSLREGFVRYLEKSPKPGPGFGLNSFPNQIICGMNSIVVATGHPYCTRLINGWWPAVMSSSENPLRILLEMFWTKICGRFNLAMPDDDSLVEESFSPLLFAQAGKVGEELGWSYKVEQLSDADLSARKPRTWEPMFVSAALGAVLMMLNGKGSIGLNDADFVNFLQKEAKTTQSAVDEIVSLGLGAVSGQSLRAVQTFAMAFLPDGRMAVAFEQDRLRLWMSRNLSLSRKGEI
jgi:hypothetical protein